MTYGALKKIMKLQKLFSLQVLHSLLSNLPDGVRHSNVKKMGLWSSLKKIKFEELHGHFKNLLYGVLHCNEK